MHVAYGHNVLPCNKRVLASRWTSTCRAPCTVYRPTRPCTAGHSDHTTAPQHKPEHAHQQAKQPRQGLPLQRLARALGLTETGLMGLLRVDPRIARLSPEAARATVEALADVTGLHPSRLPELLSSEPRVLLEPWRVGANVAGLQSELRIDRKQQRELVEREPQVLALSPEDVRGAVQQLSTALRGSTEQVIQKVLEYPQLLLQETGAVQEAVSALADATHCSQEATAAVFLHKPSLLGTPVEVLVQRVGHVARRAGASSGHVLQAAAAGGDMLAVTSCFLDRRCATALRLDLVDDPGVWWWLLLAEPAALMAANDQQLAQKQAYLRGLSIRSVDWRQSWRAMRETDRARLLLAPYRSLARLKYLIEQAEEEGERQAATPASSQGLRALQAEPTLADAASVTASKESPTTVACSGVPPQPEEGHRPAGVGLEPAPSLEGSTCLAAKQPGGAQRLSAVSSAAVETSTGGAATREDNQRPAVDFAAALSLAEEAFKAQHPKFSNWWSGVEFQDRQCGVPLRAPGSGWG